MGSKYKTLLTQPIITFAIVMIVFIFISSANYVVYHIFNFSQRNQVASYMNSLVEYGQKNAGFTRTTSGYNENKLSSSQKNVSDFESYNLYLLGAIYNIKADLAVTITTDYGECKFQWDAVNQIVSQLSNSITKRLNRGDEFTISITPYYIKYNIYPISGGKYKGRTLTITSYSHGYIKSE